MNKTILWLGLGALLLYLLSKGALTSFVSPAPKPTSGASGLTNTGTNKTAPAPWLSTLGLDKLAVQGTADTVQAAVSSGASIFSGVVGLFGGSSKASGTQSAATSGSGTGTPVDVSPTNPLPIAGTDATGTDNLDVQLGAGSWDSFGLSDFGGNSASPDSSKGAGDAGYYNVYS